MDWMELEKIVKKFDLFGFQTHPIPLNPHGLRANRTSPTMDNVSKPLKVKLGCMKSASSASPRAQDGSSIRRPFFSLDQTSGSTAPLPPISNVVPQLAGTVLAGQGRDDTAVVSSTSRASSSCVLNNGEPVIPVRRPQAPAPALDDGELLILVSLFNNLGTKME
jgi:hypothetical protein